MRILLASTDDAEAGRARSLDASTGSSSANPRSSSRTAGLGNCARCQHVPIRSPGCRRGPHGGDVSRAHVCGGRRNMGESLPLRSSALSSLPSPRAPSSQRLELIGVGAGLVPAHAHELGHHALPVAPLQMHQQLEALGEAVADGRIRHVDARLQHAPGEPPQAPGRPRSREWSRACPRARYSRPAGDRRPPRPGPRRPGCDRAGAATRPAPSREW